MKIVTILAILFFCESVSASEFSEQNRSEGKTPALTPWIHAETKPLSQQGLQPSTSPKEAELFCSFDNCLFGFSRGISVGSNIFGMITSSFLDTVNSDYKPETNLTLWDAFGTFQMLDNVGNKINANASLGARSVQFQGLAQQYDTSGLTAKINYSQVVNSLYEQSLFFELFIPFGKKSISHQNNFISSSADMNYDINMVQRINVKYPTVYLRLPGTIELANFSSSQTKMEMPIRIYGKIQPFYILDVNEFESSSEYLKISESIFGSEFAGTVSYESNDPRGENRRFSFFGELGLKIQYASIQYDRSSNVTMSVDKEPLFELSANLGGSYQF